MNAMHADTQPRDLPERFSDRPLRILHVLDHSVPLHSGYTFRTLAILGQQRALGWDTFQLTGPKQDSGLEHEQRVDGLTFYRTPTATGLAARLPLVRHQAVMKALQTRLTEVAERVRPDILHAHSPVLDAFPALRVGRARRIPVVYEVRAFWEDAAADHGTAREWGPRYRLTRALETSAVTIEQASGPGIADLRVPTATFSTETLSAGGYVRITEYAVRYHVEFDVTDAAGVTLLPRQRIDMSREYSSDASNTVGNEAQVQELQRSLNDDMVQAILFRLQAAGKHQLTEPASAARTH